MVGLKAFSNISDSMVLWKHTRHEPARAQTLGQNIPAGDPKPIVEGGSLSGGKGHVALCPPSMCPSRDFPQPLYR